MITRWLLLASLLAVCCPAMAQQTGGGTTVNQLACDLLGAGALGQSGNAVCSPLSISTALALTCAGARGPTAAQMCQTLHCPQASLKPTYHELLRSLDGATRSGLKLVTANRVWVQAGEPLVPDYVRLAQDAFGAEPEALNFHQPAALATINGWVAEHTAGKIPQLLKQLQADTRLVLTNAVYFKGLWASPFDPARTHAGKFILEGGQPIQVPTMHGLGLFRCSGAAVDLLAGPPAQVQVLELPYAGGRLVMDLMVPPQGNALAELERSLTLPTLNEWLERLHVAELNIAVPRFAVDYRVELPSVLDKLGMHLAFTPGADFSGLARGPLWLSQVVHQSTLITDEQGSEGAAATAAVVTRSLPARLDVDRPFLFLIRDRETGTIVFLGRVVNPSQGGRV